MHFWDVDSGTEYYKRGRLKKLVDPDGNETLVTYLGGKLREVTRTSGGVTDSYLYDYHGSTNAKAMLERVTQRKNGVAERKTEYQYYSADANGNTGTLKLVEVKDAAGAIIDREYYRWYKDDQDGTAGEPKGYHNGLKYFVGHAAYERMVQAQIDPLTATDNTLAPYADNYFEYDDKQRVTKSTVQGAGCTLGAGCAEGLGTSTYTYTASIHTGYANWAMKTEETRPDTTKNIVFTNQFGQVLLTVFQTPAGSWRDFYKYDGAGKLLWHAHPSAVTGHDEAKPDLLDWFFDNTLGIERFHYRHLDNTKGLIDVTGYPTIAPQPPPTEGEPGGVLGYVSDTSLMRGEFGTPVKQSEFLYYLRTVTGFGGGTTYPMARRTVFRTAGAADPQTTSYNYTWLTGKLQVESQTVTRPIVTTAQNGPNVAVSDVVFHDTFGRPIWTKDADGFLSYTEYDTYSGAVTKTISDVDSTRTGDFANKPIGWTTPAGGGLHLITTFQVDAFGRTKKVTAPNGNISYTVYKDAAHEVRTYPGWDTVSAGCSTSAPCTTGPIGVTRDDRTRGYSESLTISGLPAVDPGTYLPTGNDPITTNVKTLSRSHTNRSGQVKYADRYVNLTGLTYSTDAILTNAVLGTHYHRTFQDYDQAGRQSRTKTATATIHRTWYDDRGRVVSTWIGTDDTSWSIDACAAPCNMVKVSQNVYDGLLATPGTSGIGDGNLTQVTQFPGTGVANRVMQHFYDWRNRRVATKGGAENPASGEDLNLNRPVGYTEYDNLSQVTAQEHYDGDRVTFDDLPLPGDGVPDRPAQAARRARSLTHYDEQGRVYRTETYSVDQTTGALSASTLKSDTWYNKRGQVIKTAQPGGLVSKTASDGAGRTTKTYATDGGGDTTWTDAGTLTGDAVLSQAQTTYDAGGNVLQTTRKDRFHDETATGELGNVTTAPKARVSYVGQYYDKADRLTHTVNVGTYGGSAYNRLDFPTPPARSDTVLVTSQTYNASGWVEHVTDPRGIVRRTEYDHAGRTLKTIEHYTNGVPTADSNRTTEYTYDGSDHVLTLKAVLPGGGQQTTLYDYQAAVADGHDLNSNDLLAWVFHPDKDTGAPSAAAGYVEQITYNALGQPKKARYDRNGTLHEYKFDVVGRLTEDQVSAVGGGVDSAVQRLATAYDTAGRPYLFTSWTLPTGGTIVNEVRRDYNGLGQLRFEYQSHAGAVNTGTTPKVEYAYSEMTGGVNHSRPTGLTYPNGRVVNSTYGTAGGLDDRISRLSALTNGGTTFEQYAYLGLGTVVKRTRPQGPNEIGLSYLEQTGDPACTPGVPPCDGGDKYRGLDRFGRVVDQRWLKSNDVPNPLDRFQYGYDRNSNRLYRANAVNTLFSELYHANGASAGYDNFNQLKEYRRGLLSDTNADGIPDTVATATKYQRWALDVQGNWDSVTTSLNGTDEATQTREHNRQNQIKLIPGYVTPVYSNNGEMTTDQTNKTLVYDAWGRLVEAKSGLTRLVRYTYDALARRICETTGAAPAETLCPTDAGTRRDFYYSDGWQVLEERTGASPGLLNVQYVWSPVYVDAMILRDRDMNGDGTVEGAGDERLYVVQDGNWNVTAVTNPAGQVLERFAYLPFARDPAGTQTVYLNPSWGEIASSTVAWVYLHQGGRYEIATGLYHFRHRELSPAVGRWNRQDPNGFGAGDTNLYRYVHNTPATATDAMGLEKVIYWSIERPNTLVRHISLRYIWVDLPPKVDEHPDASVSWFPSSLKLAQTYGPSKWDEGRKQRFTAASIKRIEEGWNDRGFHLRCVATGERWKMKLKVTVKDAGADFDIKVLANPYRQVIGSQAEIGGKEGGITGYWDEDDVNAVPSGEPNSGQNTIAHEVGHILGLRHPTDPKTGQEKYEADKTGLMGWGNEMRYHYYASWVMGMHAFGIPGTWVVLKDGEK